MRAVDADAVLFVQPDCFLAPGFVDGRPRRLDDPASGRWPPSCSAPRARRPRQRLDAIDTAGMSLDRRRKNGLVGHGRPALAFDTVSEAFGADGAVALYRRRRSRTRRGGEVFDEDSCDDGVAATGPPTPTWRGARG